MPFSRRRDACYSQLMRWTIGRRIFAALTITSLVIVGLNAAATRWSFQRSFVDYLVQQEAERLAGVIEALVEIHGRDGSWAVFTTDPRQWDLLLYERGGRRERRRNREDDAHRPPGGGPPPDPLAMRARVTLIDVNDEIIIGRDPRGSAARHDIIAAGERIGSLLVQPQNIVTGEVDRNFAAAQTRSITTIGIAVLLLAAVIAMLVARQLARPIASLAAGAKALTIGELDRRIKVVRDDELGDLAKDFNALATVLEKNQRERRRWVSDISHELRTPLAILSGELQAIEDGVRQFDDATRQSLQAEVERLGKLINDLHELTLSDEAGLRYEHETVNIGAVLQETIEASRTRVEAAGLRLDFDNAESSLLIAGDSARLEQLFINLIENSLRYTDAPGELLVSLSDAEAWVRIVFSDSAPAVAAEHHRHLFDRLYRVDRSRNRSSGGSGLGLAICESIVKAHGGTISAADSDFGGLSVEVRLPKLAGRRSTA